jgi:hypothetical protein
MCGRLYSIGARSYQTGRKEDRAPLMIDGDLLLNSTFKPRT